MPDAGATRNPYSTATSGYTAIPTTDLARWLNHSWGNTPSGFTQFLKERFPGGVDEAITKDGNLYVKPKNPAESSNAFITQLQTSDPNKWEVPKPAPGLVQGIMGGDSGGFGILVKALATAGIGGATGLSDIISGLGGAPAASTLADVTSVGGAGGAVAAPLIGDIAAGGGLTGLSGAGLGIGVDGLGGSTLAQTLAGSTAATGGAMDWDWQDPSTWTSDIPDAGSTPFDPNIAPEPGPQYQLNPDGSPVTNPNGSFNQIDPVTGLPVSTALGPNWLQQAQEWLKSKAVDQAGQSALSRIFGGNATAADWTKLAGTVDCGAQQAGDPDSKIRPRRQPDLDLPLVTIVFI